MERPGRRVAAVLPIVGATLGAILLVVAGFSLVDSRGFAYDFGAYDSAARRVAAGEPLYPADTAQAYSEGRYEGLYLYPPPLAVALTPVALVPAREAAIGWFVLRLILLALGCWAMPVSRAVRLATFAVAAVSFPVLFDLNLGNISVVVFALSAFAWRLLDGPLAALIHAALVAIRFPFGAFFVLWLVQRRFRIIIFTVVAGLGLIVASLPIVGVGAYRDYVTILAGLPDVSTGMHNFSLKSTALALGLPAAIAAFATIFGLVASLAAIAFAARRRDVEVAFVVTAVATLLTAPFMHPHYLVMLLLPAALLVDRGRYWGLALPLVGWLPIFGVLSDDAMPLVVLAILAVLLLPMREPAGRRRGAGAANDADTDAPTAPVAPAPVG
jgi:hypothetical protein